MEGLLDTRHDINVGDTTETESGTISSGYQDENRRNVDV